MAQRSVPNNLGQQFHSSLLMVHSVPDLFLSRGFLNFSSEEKVKEYSERRLLG